MVDIDLIYKLDAKIVNNEGEGERPGFVPPYARGVGAFVISKRCQFAAESFVGKNTRLR
jgi:hypothetical protein